MQQVRKSFIFFVVIGVVLGFLGGVVGELWINSFLMPDPYLSFKSYSDLSKKLDELITTQDKVTNLDQRDAKVNEMLNKVQGTTVSVYKYKKLSTTNFASLLPEDYLSQGIIITNDGWLMVSNSGARNDKAKYLVVTSENKILETDKVVVDKYTGVTFMKVNANNLSVAEFALRENLVNGQTLFALGTRRNVTEYNIKNLNYSNLARTEDFLHSSEIFYKDILLSGAVAKESFGSPVMTTDGRVAGIIKDETGLVLPIDHLIQQMKNIVQGQNWVRPYLGLSFYDLSEVVNSDITQTKGIMISRVRGISLDSPAVSILETGDIVLRVENEEINQNRNFCDIISTYKAGDSLKLTILRGAEQKEVTVKSASMK